MRQSFVLWALLPAILLLSPVAAQPPDNGPWNRDLYLVESADGVRFDGRRRFVERGGVPAVIRDAKGRLLAAFQWFPFERRDAFDRIAVKTSDDDGKTWSEPLPIRVRGLSAGWVRPCDPTLALLEDGGIRLYFTSDPRDGKGPGTYSAISTDGVHYAFEAGARFRVEGETVLDCAVARLGKTWHYYAPIQGPGGRAYHAVSEDGLRFTRVADVSLPGNRAWLGCVVPVRDGLRFYGTGGGVWSAVSRDGVTWQLDDGSRATGADPGVAQTRDGRFVMLVTGGAREGLPREQRPDRVTLPVLGRPFPAPDRLPGPGPGGPLPPGAAAITVHGKYLYVVYNGMLYQYDAEELRLVRHVRLPGSERGPGARRFFPPEPPRDSRGPEAQEQSTGVAD